MIHPKTFAETLDREFLVTRGKILELAATLDRLDRSLQDHAQDNNGTPDRRLAQLAEALKIVLEPEPGRAERIQQLFSRPYDPEWQKQFSMPHPRF